MKNKNLPFIVTLSAVTFAGSAFAKKDGGVQEDVIEKVAQAEVGANGLISAKTDTTRAAGVARPWAHDKSDIKPDAKTLYGKLDNGMRYIIHKNALPPERVSIRLHVDAGSLNEKESQRGVAHFLEHMVFNGTKTFPDATKLVPQMQRLGIAFGAHANAYTSFDETVYMLDLPDIKKSTVDLAFNVMGDFADGALLSDAEIDEERGVISSEKTSRDSIQFRMMERQFKYLLPKSLIAERFPIGTDKVIAEAPRSEFVDFYTSYYTPEKMTFIVVGDIDVAEIEQRITDTFGGIKNPAKPGAKASVGDVSGKKGFNTAVFADKELSSTDISLFTIRNKEREVDNVANRAKDIPLSIANAIINRRFSRLVKEEGSVITSGSASASTLFQEAEMGNFSVTAKGENWQAAIPALEQEMRRAIEHGFTQSEFDEIKASLINSYEQSVETAATRKSKSIAGSLAQHIHGDFVYSTPETDLELFKANIDKVNPESCHQAFKKFWDIEDVTLVLSTSQKPDGAEEALASLYERSKLVKVETTEDKKVDAFAYTNFGKAGKIVSEKYVKDLNIHQIQFENGVRVNYKKTDFDKNQILISGNFGTGKIMMPADKPGLDMLAGAVVNGGGLGKHSADDLRTLLTGKNVGVNLGIGNESFSISGATIPKDLELQLQLICAALTDAGYRPEAERQFKAVVPMMYQQMKHSAGGAQAEMSGWMHGEDYRFIVPKKDALMKLTSDDVKEWIDPQMKSAALEIGIVGDFDEKKLLTLLAKTIGALPKRDEPVKIADSARVINIPDTPMTKTFTFDSKVPTATAIVGWKAEDNTDKDVKLARRAGILAEVLSDRMRIKLREELGDAYSPGAGSNLSQDYKNVGFIMAYSPVKIENLDSVSKVLVELADKLAKEGATQDELDRALTPKLGMLKKTLRSNGYWLGTVVSKSQTQPEHMDWSRGRDADYKSITVEDINKLAQQYLTADRSLTIKIAPAAAAATTTKNPATPSPAPAPAPEKPAETSE